MILPCFSGHLFKYYGILIYGNKVVSAGRQDQCSDCSVIWTVSIGCLFWTLPFNFLLSEHESLASGITMATQGLSVLRDFATAVIAFALWLRDSSLIYRRPVTTARQTVILLSGSIQYFSGRTDFDLAQNSGNSHLSL